MASYRKRKNGKWQARITVDGNQQSKGGFRTKTEAKLWAEPVERMMRDSSGYDADITLYDYVKKWYGVHKRPTLAPRTNQRNDNLVEWVKRLFGDLKLVDLTASMYQDKLNFFGQTHSKSTLEKFHAVVAPCMDYAVHNGHIKRSPIFNITLKGNDSQKEEKTNYLSKSEASKLQKALLDRYKPWMTSRVMALFGLATGARIGEIMALEEDDVDLDENIVNIKHTYDYAVEHCLKEPKTKSSLRSIYIDDNTSSLLRKQIIYNKERMMKHSVRPKNQFIFSNKNFKPISPTAANATLAKACKRAGVPHITFHGLRHTHASIMIYEELPIKYVSQRLGHSKVSMTLDTYQHVIQEMEDKSNNRVVEILNQIQS